jgi:hypothetical protein
METVEIVTSDVLSNGIRTRKAPPFLAPLPVPVAPSLAFRAFKLAYTVRSIASGIFSVGACVVDRWRASCSCKVSRIQKQTHQSIANPCVHFLAVFLAEGIEAWHPVEDQLAESYQSQGFQIPFIKKWYCRLSGARGIWEFIEAGGDGWLCFISSNGKQTTFAPLADVIHFHPVIEEIP